MFVSVLPLLASLQAAAPAAVQPLSSHDPQTVVSWLQKEGFRAKLEPSTSKEKSVGPFISTADGGTNFYIYFLNCKDKKLCEDVQFSAAWDFETGKGPAATVMHDWNAKKRFTKAYLDKEGDPYLEMDVLFADRRLSPKAYDESFQIFVSALPIFRKEIGWDKSDDAATASTQTVAARK
jgi:hypothetical protein